VLGVKVPLETNTWPQVESVWAELPLKDSDPWYQSTAAVGLKLQPACRPTIGEAEMNDADASIAAREMSFAIVVMDFKLDDASSA